MTEKNTIQDITIEENIINSFLQSNGYDFIINNMEINNKYIKLKEDIFNRMIPIVTQLEEAKKMKQNADKIKEEIKNKNNTLVQIENILLSIVSKKKI